MPEGNEKERKVCADRVAGNSSVVSAGNQAAVHQKGTQLILLCILLPIRFHYSFTECARMLFQDVPSHFNLCLHASTLSIT